MFFPLELVKNITKKHWFTKGILYIGAPRSRTDLDVSTKVLIALHFYAYESLINIRQIFYMKHHFPGVIGCIHYTYVVIHSASIDDPEFPEHLYVNRTNYHSINVQLICYSDLST
ncbi:hypothetical protein JTB14_032736 [Gonioctena quinquepunctata]|nr:hypothetical protein JTB14_032736 [Gonioctena quinquepunctata]